MSTLEDQIARLNFRKVDHIVISTGGVPAGYVAIDAYVALLDERDDLRRQLALINAWRRHHSSQVSPDAGKALARLLAAVGETDDLGDAVREIAASLGVERPVWS